MRLASCRSRIIIAFHLRPKLSLFVGGRACVQIKINRPTFGPGAGAGAAPFLINNQQTGQIRAIAHSSGQLGETLASGKRLSLDRLCAELRLQDCVLLKVQGRLKMAAEMGQPRSVLRRGGRRKESLSLGLRLAQSWNKVAADRRRR